MSLSQNYTVVDGLGALRGMAGFGAVLFCPGYVVGWAADVFGFRRRGLLERVAWAVGLSFGVVAIFTALAGPVIGLGGVVGVLFVGVMVAAAMLWVGRRRMQMPKGREVKLLAVFGVVAAALIVLQLVDWQTQSGLQLSVTVFDQSYRVGFTDAVARWGIPPENPFFHPGEASPLRYYYFWYALCAVVMKLAHVSARQALIASSVWVEVGLAAMVALYCRYFLRVREGLYRYILTGTLLLAVTGLDLLPTLYNLFVNHEFAGDLEWWSADQVSSWMDSVLWVPNHVSAVVCCLTALLLLWRTREAGVSRKDLIWARVLAGVAGASAFGLSVYVTLGFAMVMASWVAMVVVRDREWKTAGRVGGAMVLSGVLLIPYVREMLRSHSGTGSGAATGPARLLVVGVREMFRTQAIVALPMFAGWRAAHPRLLTEAIRLVLLVPGYALELGFYGAVLVVAWSARRRLDEARRTLLDLAVCGLVVVSFLRSAVIGNNDFGYRAAMLPCFFLLLLGADALVGELRPAGKWMGVLRRLVLLGAAGTAFQAIELRAFVPLHTAGKAAGFVELPARVLEMRRTYEQVRPLLARDAIVQANPTDGSDYYFFVSMLDSGFPMVTDAAKDCGAVFGGDPAKCTEVQVSLKRLFAAPALGVEEARTICTQTGAEYLAVSSRDGAWGDKGGWVWGLPVVGAGENFRVVECGGGR